MKSDEAHHRLILTGDSLTIEDVIAVARRYHPVAYMADAPQAVQEQMARSAGWKAGRWPGGEIQSKGW